MTNKNYSEILVELDNFFISHKNKNIDFTQSEFKKWIHKVPEKKLDYEFFHTLFFSELVSKEETKKHLFSFIDLVFDQYPNWYKTDSNQIELNKLGINTLLRIDSYPGAFDFLMKIIDKVDINYLDNSNMRMSYYLFSINSEKRISLLNTFIDKNIQFNNSNKNKKICDFYLGNLYYKSSNLEKIEIDTFHALLSHPNTRDYFKEEIFFNSIFFHPVINSIWVHLDLEQSLIDKNSDKKPILRKSKI